MGRPGLKTCLRDLRAGDIAGKVERQLTVVVVVSICSVTDRNATFSLCSCSIINRRCGEGAAEAFKLRNDEGRWPNTSAP